MEAFLIEAELLLDWYLPRLEVTLPDEARAAFRVALARGAAAGDRFAPTWVLRDFHSPNLLWLPERATGSPGSACSTSRTP